MPSRARRARRADAAGDRVVVSKEKKRWHLSTPAIAGLVALVSGMVTLLFTLSPSLKPDPGEAISAKLEVLTFERHVRYSDYLERLGDNAPKAKVAREVLDEVGFIVNLGITVNGRKRHDIELTKTHYVAGSRRRFTPPQPLLGFESETPSDAWVFPAFVVAPEMEAGFKFFEHFELVDGDTILAIADTRALDPAS